jgi:hypothetical protein
MIRLTHPGRRTRRDRDDRLPVVAPSRAREAAHPAGRFRPLRIGDAVAGRAPGPQPPPDALRAVKGL